MHTRTVLALFLIGGFLCSCSPTLDLAFRVPEKMDYHYLTESTTAVETKVMGINVENNTINNMTYRLKHLGQNPEGQERFEMTYETINWEQRTMGQESIYDSKNPERTNDPNLDNIYGVLLDNGFELLYDQKGQLVAAPGLEELMQEMFKQAPAEVQGNLQNQFGGDAMLQSLKSTTSYYPEISKVKMGSSWTATNELAIGGMELIIDTKYTLLEVKDGKAKIKLESEIDSNPEAEGLQIMGMSMKFDLQGTQEGFLYVDEKTSWMEHMELDQYLDGIMNLQSEQTGNMDMDMTIRTTQLIKLLD